MSGRVRGFRPSHTLTIFAGVFMRTYEMHAHAKQVTRSSGRSSVAAAAYRSASRLYDERTGLWHDFTRKQGVEDSRIYMDDGATDWWQEAQAEAKERRPNATQQQQHDEAVRLYRSKLWNGVETKETRSNAATAHEIEYGFPSEFNAMQRREAGDTIAREILRRYGGAVDISYHRPDSKEPEHAGEVHYANFHAHMMFTTRGFDRSTKDGWAKTKFRDLSQDRKDKDGNPYLDAEGNPTTRGQLEILSLRAFAAAEMNRIAERDGLEVHTEHLSFEKRGIDKEPTRHLGAAATQMEARNEPSERGELNRNIQAANDNVAALRRQQAQMEDDHRKELKLIDLDIEREKRRQHWQIDRLQAEKAEAQRQMEARQTWLFKWVFRGSLRAAENDYELASRHLDRAERGYHADLKALDKGLSDRFNEAASPGAQRSEERGRSSDDHRYGRNSERTTEDIAQDYLELARNPMRDLHRWLDETEPGGGRDRVLPSGSVRSGRDHPLQPFPSPEPRRPDLTPTFKQEATRSERDVDATDNTRRPEAEQSTGRDSPTSPPPEREAEPPEQDREEQHARTSYVFKRASRGVAQEPGRSSYVFNRQAANDHGKDHDRGLER